MNCKQLKLTMKQFDTQLNFRKCKLQIVTEIDRIECEINISKDGHYFNDDTIHDLVNELNIHENMNLIFKAARKQMRQDIKYGIAVYWKWG